MTRPHPTIWSILAAVFAGLTLLMLGIAGTSPKPDPIVMGPGKVPAPDNLSISAAVEIDAPDKASPAAKGFIDDFYKIGKYLAIVGWAYIDLQPTTDQLVYVQLEKIDGSRQHYATGMKKREDVVAAFHNPLYLNAGFTALIALNDTPYANIRTVRMVIKNQSGTYITKPIKMVPRSAAPRKSLKKK